MKQMIFIFFLTLDRLIEINLRGRVEHVDEHQAEGDEQHDSRRHDFLSPEIELMGTQVRNGCLVITLLRQLKLMDIFLLGFSK